MELGVGFEFRRGSLSSVAHSLVQKRAVDVKIIRSQTYAMKVARRTRARKQKINRQAQTFTLSNAKSDLGRLTAKAMQGEPVYIVRGQHRFILQQVWAIEPIPMRPPGYFANCYTKEEIELENRLSKASVIRPPKDLE